MKPNQLFRRKSSAFIKVSVISLFLLSSLNLIAQTPANFSGSWEFDKTRSDKDERGDASFNGTIILEITQNSSIITFASTYIRPGKDDFKIKPDSVFIDGRVTTDNSGSDPAKKFVKWSQDKKILTTNLIMTASIDGVKQDFLTANTYKLSDDGKTLFAEEFHKSKLNGEKRIKKVYRRKP